MEGGWVVTQVLLGPLPTSYCHESMSTRNFKLEWGQQQRINWQSSCAMIAATTTVKNIQSEGTCSANSSTAMFLDGSKHQALNTDNNNWFWWFWPVNDATHVDLQLAVVSQQSLLHHDQVNCLVVHSEETHAALEGVKRVSTFLTVVFRRTTWTRK